MISNNQITTSDNQNRLLSWGLRKEQDCLDAGMDDYIGKPIRLENLMDKFEKWCK